MRISRFWRGLAIVALLMATGLQSSPARAFTLELSSDLKGWDASILPIHYNPVDCSVTQSQLEEAIDTAVVLWNSVPMSSLKLKRGRISSSTASGFNVDLSANPPQILDSPVILCSTDFGVDSGLDDANESLGINQIVPAVVRPAAIEGRLVYAPMLLNSTPGANANIANYSQEKLTIIIAHEIGHMLGLGHVSDPASLMFFNVSDKGLLALSRDDAEGVTYLYPRQEPFAGEFMGCGTISAISRGRGGGDGASGAGRQSGGRFPVLFSWVAVLALCFAISRLRWNVQPLRL